MDRNKWINNKKEWKKDGAKKLNRWYEMLEILRRGKQLKSFPPKFNRYLVQKQGGGKKIDEFALKQLKTIKLYPRSTR